MKPQLSRTQILQESRCVHSPAHAFSFYGGSLYLPFLPELAFLQCRADYTLCSLSGPPLSPQSVAPPHHDSLPSHDIEIWINGSFSFLIGKSSAGFLANCSLSGAEATLSFSTGPVGQGFLVEAAPCCELPAGLGNTNKFAISLLSDSRFAPAILFSPFTLNSLANLKGSVFSLLLYYQVAISPRTLISSGQRRG